MLKYICFIRMLKYWLFTINCMGNQRSLKFISLSEHYFVRFSSSALIAPVSFGLLGGVVSLKIQIVSFSSHSTLGIIHTSVFRMRFPFFSSKSIFWTNFCKTLFCPWWKNWPFLFGLNYSLESFLRFCVFKNWPS